ncbi:MAG: MBL fold metallo-hydrolase [Gammaproteobacteria bacterium]|nr:MBL fold metallo-hydrolase [Gammaproteobacteria bacterium]
MLIKFWGVRGSIPCPGINTVKYGGNTACIEVRFPEINRILIIDAGSGLRELGNDLMAQQQVVDTDLLLTHTHWDHIMGFPFFIPAYIPGTDIRVYGPVTYEEDTLEKVVGGQMTYRYFPVREAELSANINYISLQEEEFDLGDGIIVKTRYLNHPVLCLAYRIEYQGKVFCTAYDTESYNNVFITDPQDPDYDQEMAEEGDLVASEQNAMIEEFYQGADFLVHDSQFTQEEYEQKYIGWGHCHLEYVCQAIQRQHVKKVAFFHHDPLRTDEQLDEMTTKYCTTEYCGQTKSFFAKEGMVIEL